MPRDSWGLRGRLPVTRGGDRGPSQHSTPHPTLSSTGLFFLILLQRQTAPANAAFLVHCSLESYSCDRVSFPTQGVWVPELKPQEHAEVCTGLRYYTQCLAAAPGSCPPVSTAHSLCPPPIAGGCGRGSHLSCPRSIAAFPLKPRNTEQVIRFLQVFTFNFSTLLTL